MKSNPKKTKKNTEYILKLTLKETVVLDDLLNHTKLTKNNHPFIPEIKSMISKIDKIKHG